MGIFHDAVVRHVPVFGVGRGIDPEESQLWSMRVLDPEGAAVLVDALAETGRGLGAIQYGHKDILKVLLILWYCVCMTM